MKHIDILAFFYLKFQKNISANSLKQVILGSDFRLVFWTVENFDTTDGSEIRRDEWRRPRRSARRWSFRYVNVNFQERSP